MLTSHAEFDCYPNHCLKDDAEVHRSPVCLAIASAGQSVRVGRITLLASPQPSREKAPPRRGKSRVRLAMLRFRTSRTHVSRHPGPISQDIGNVSSSLSLCKAYRSPKSLANTGCPGPGCMSWSPATGLKAMARSRPDPGARQRHQRRSLLMLWI